MNEVINLSEVDVRFVESGIPQAYGEEEYVQEFVVESLAEVIDVDRYETPFDAVLELVHTAPSFDHLRSSEVEDSLGHGFHFSVDMPDKTIRATSVGFDFREDISRSNFPMSVGHSLQSKTGDMLKLVDIPTDGPLFVLPLEPEQEEAKLQMEFETAQEELFEMGVN